MIKFKYLPKAILVCLTFILLLTEVYVTTSANSISYSGIAYNSITLETIGDLEDITVIKNEENMLINFSLNGRGYDINAKLLDDSKNPSGSKYIADYKDINGQVYCNILVFDDKISGVIINNDISLNKKAKEIPDIAFVISTGEVEDLKNTISMSVNNENIKYEIESNAEMVNSWLGDDIKFSTTKSESIAAISSVNTVHALAKAPSIYVVVSGSIAEGWVDTSFSYGNSSGVYYTVNNFRYNVFYNWPSDGVDLWYDSSTKAAGTVAFPPSGVQTLPGSWTVNSSTGKLYAHATSSVLVNKVPIMWEFYDNVPIS